MLIIQVPYKHVHRYRIDMCLDIFVIPGIIEYVYPCYEHIISIYKIQRLVKKQHFYYEEGGRGELSCVLPHLM